jgi:hypothetical protein
MNLLALETEACKKEVNEAKKAAWENTWRLLKKSKRSCSFVGTTGKYFGPLLKLQACNRAAQSHEPISKDIGVAVNKALRLTYGQQSAERDNIISHKQQYNAINAERYNSYLFSQSNEAALNITEVKPTFSDESKMVDGREVMQAFFDIAITRDPSVFAFGEDVGKIGDVNQGFAGLQEKHGESRVFDTGIRELNNYRTRNWCCVAWLTSYCRDSIFRLFALRITTIK